MAREYSFDREHFQALREMGWRNVPADKVILLSIVSRWYPDESELPRRVAAIKKAIQRLT
jgi:hypothetical protein